MTHHTTTLLHAAGRDWAHTATPCQRRRAHRVLRLAKPTSDPTTVLRFVLRSKTREDLAMRIGTIFGGMPSIEAVQSFVHGATAVESSLHQPHADHLARAV